jgi:hypothetical protein
MLLRATATPPPAIGAMRNSTVRSGWNAERDSHTVVTPSYMARLQIRS